MCKGNKKSKAKMERVETPESGADEVFASGVPEEKGEKQAPNFE
jgi:hypothetical protein